jgi:hypothetical protein
MSWNPVSALPLDGQGNLAEMSRNIASASCKNPTQMNIEERHDGYFRKHAHVHARRRNRELYGGRT